MAEGGPSAPPKDEHKLLTLPPMSDITTAGLLATTNTSHARPPATNPLDSTWLSPDEKDSIVKPKIDVNIHKPTDDAPGIIRIAEGMDIYTALDQLDLMYSMSIGDSCCGRIIDQGQLGVIERRGLIKFTKPGQWCLWNAHTRWANIPSISITEEVIRAKGISIVTLDQKNVMVVRDKDGRTSLLNNGRFILLEPAQPLIDKPLSLVGLEKYQQINRFGFFNVPQGEVAGITLPSGQVRILLPGVHIVEDCKFERFLPTVPIQSKLKKDVVTSDLVTVSLEVDIATQLVDCARFLKMSASATSHDGKQGVGCKDLYDAIEETAQSHFIDTFGKTQYYAFRTRQGEEESKFEEAALNVLDREARKYGGQVLKVNILKQRADAVEQVYSAHNHKQIELEQRKQSQQRQYDIEDAEQKHKQQMAEREEKGMLQKLQLTHEREMQKKAHEVRLTMQETKSAQEKMDFEAKAIAQRDQMKAQMESEAAKVRAAGQAEQQAQQILIVARANAQAEEVRALSQAKTTELRGIAAAKAEEVRGFALARSEQVRAEARLGTTKQLAIIMKDSPAILEIEKSRIHEEFAVQKLRAIVDGGARVIPVEILRLMDIADERILRRLENQTVLHSMGGPSSSQKLISSSSVVASAAAGAVSVSALEDDKK